jgi:hypothetical protein
MISDVDAVGLCVASYQNPLLGAWDHFWDGTDPDGICGGIKNNTLVLRGSITREDWFRDFEVVKLGPRKFHPEFGSIHAGFDEGLDEFAAKALPLLSDGATFCGHSLGAAHAWLLAGRYILQAGRPGGIKVFGSPRPGCLQFAQYVASVPKSSYRNGLDPVTEVPLVIGDEIAIEPTSFKLLHVTPTDWSEGFMAWHSIHLYAQGVTASS